MDVPRGVAYPHFLHGSTYEVEVLTRVRKGQRIVARPADAVCPCPIDT
jgi:hypothetical protein